MTQLGLIPADADLQVTNDVWPTGSIAFFAGLTAPSGWRACDGSAVTNPSPLYNVVGAQVPNLVGRSVCGVDSAEIALLATKGSISHTHSAAGLGGASHYHGAGTYSVDAGHGHGNSFYCGSHTHGTSCTTAAAITKSNDTNGYTSNYLTSTSTGAGNGGIGGSINGSNQSLPVSGNSNWTDPGIGGNTDASSPPYQVGLWIIKT